MSRNKHHWLAISTSYFTSICYYENSCKLLEKLITGRRVDTWARWQLKRDLIKMQGWVSQSKKMLIQWCFPWPTLRPAHHGKQPNQCHIFPALHQIDGHWWNCHRYYWPSYQNQTCLLVRLMIFWIYTMDPLFLEGMKKWRWPLKILCMQFNLSLTGWKGQL